MYVAKLSLLENEKSSFTSFAESRFYSEKFELSPATAPHRFTSSVSLPSQFLDHSCNRYKKRLSIFFVFIKINLAKSEQWAAKKLDGMFMSLWIVYELKPW